MPSINARLRDSLTVLLGAALLQGCSSLSGQAISGDAEQNKPSANDAITTATDARAATAAPEANPYLLAQADYLPQIPAAVIANYQQALSAMRAQQWSQARSLLNQVIDVAPQLSGAHLNLALIAIEQQQWDLAASFADSAIRANSGNPYAHQTRGFIASKQGHFVAAEQHYQQALSLWPHYPTAHLNLAILYELYRGELLQAHQHYLAYLALEPSNSQAQRWLASVEIKIKRAGLTLPPRDATASAAKESR
ncbi:tetratricopeptide repeat protein [uncultured Ferrimonas sp.]|uniref:tetratricopeptide repeat protein n=1 Tax=uncultured Ferrimonas sp. TaxID=432640 RepID=UPI00263552F9|nr:tetratricopeptide repeat protein [uncultured Ferrimonas sp.]